MDTLYTYLPKGKKEVYHTSSYTAHKDSLYNVARNDVRRTTFEQTLTQPHKKILVGRRILSGVFYYAYFLLFLQLCVLSIPSTHNTSFFSLHTVFVSLLSVFSVFLIMEIAADIKQGTFSLTSILSEMLMRSYYKSYNALGVFSKAWKEVKASKTDIALRHSLSLNRDRLIYLYQSSTDKKEMQKESYMKMASVVMSPEMTSLWTYYFPNWFKSLTLEIDGGVVHSLHNMALGTNYSMVSGLDFVLRPDSLVKGALKTVFRAVTGRINRRPAQTIDDMVSDATYNTHGRYVIGHDSVRVVSQMSGNVNDLGTVKLHHVSFDVSLEFDRAFQNSCVINKRILRGVEFEITK